jgi:hypothetical protein
LNSKRSRNVERRKNWKTGHNAPMMYTPPRAGSVRDYPRTPHMAQTARPPSRHCGSQKLIEIGDARRERARHPPASSHNATWGFTGPESTRPAERDGRIGGAECR